MGTWMDLRKTFRNILLRCRYGTLEVEFWDTEQHGIGLEAGAWDWAAARFETLR